MACTVASRGADPHSPAVGEARGPCASAGAIADGRGNRLQPTRRLPCRVALGGGGGSVRFAPHIASEQGPIARRWLSHGRVAKCAPPPTQAGLPFLVDMRAWPTLARLEHICDDGRALVLDALMAHGLEPHGCATAGSVARAERSWGSGLAEGRANRAFGRFGSGRALSSTVKGLRTPS